MGRSRGKAVILMWILRPRPGRCLGANLVLIEGYNRLEEDGVARQSDRRASRAAVWSARLAKFALPVLAITALGHRFDLVDTPSALVLLAACWLGALVSLIFGLSALRPIWRLGLAGTRRALTGILVSVPILAVPAYFLPLLIYNPRLTDVSTDLLDPPALEAAAALRPVDANPITRPGVTAMRLQLAAYPQLRPLRVGVSIEDAFNAARAAVRDRGWRIVAERPPSEDGGPARIEAEARTLLMAFKDDVVIRIRQEGGGTRIDIRSASRYGAHDLGTNARRIQAFLFALREQIAPTAGGER